ncbi:hypothetical protein BDK51DRAFT_15736 [Blyttiomyces helicus]|uniref:DNA-directed RNA polymerase n=1 Tax=Blyttiomyces helicus TaxID=388810 RepID=A0A4P9VZV5_9FUNG|nr:hypothetical protein BDK51DRAFT_15736 [Blyttiomyces helicus]|eukprot:RKO85324.1 hypothetical protein BDK51DRAFT_15736 [Blyttiomyces helicus]
MTESDDCTHYEIHPSLQFGIAASTMPYANYNQAARITFGSSMANQAISHDPKMYKMIRDDVCSLWYGHREISYTYMSKRLTGDKIRTGCSVFIAMLPNGYNMDDALVIKRQSLERGLFTSTKKRYQRVENHKASHIGVRLNFEEPNMKDVRSKNGIVRAYLDDYRYSSDGVINEGMLLGERQEIATRLHRDIEDYKRTRDDVRNIFRKQMRIKRVIRSNDDISNFYNVVAESTRVPIIGDKFASRLGQKGVCGMIFDRTELPYTEDGMVPDIVMNPHSIPSRMTVGHLIEMFIGRAAAENFKGEFESGRFEATAFVKYNYKLLIDFVKGTASKYGEKMYNPRTGDLMEGEVFTGICHYYALKHQVDDKIFYRTLGPVKFTTKHPTEGKSEQGGLKMGIMEIDGLIAHGSVETILDKTRKETDDILTYACDTCGSILNTKGAACIACSFECACDQKGCDTCMQQTEVKTTNSFAMTVQFMKSAGVNTTVVLPSR